MGLGLTVATGIALGDDSINVHCIISDGECAEGSIWEALRFISDYPVKNIKVYCNMNGWSAYQKVDTEKIERRLKSFLEDIVICKTDVNEILQWDSELSAHYTTANNKMLEELKLKIGE